MLSLDSNTAWLDALRGPRRDEALQTLRVILVRGLRGALTGHADLAEDFAQEALLKILDSLDTFRGESRFTTWAHKIAVRIALTELRRKRWQDVSLQDAAHPSNDAPPRLPADAGPDPAEQAGIRLLLAEVERAMAETLTERQRTALQAVMWGGMPLEEVARRMGTNRNALYKLIHDARLRLRTTLERRGITLNEEWIHAP